jgi:hypothetical protein
MYIEGTSTGCGSDPNFVLSSVYFVARLFFRVPPRADLHLLIGRSCPLPSSSGPRSLHLNLRLRLPASSLTRFVGCPRAISYRGSEQLKNSSGSDPRQRGRATNRTTPLPIAWVLPPHRASICSCRDALRQPPPPRGPPPCLLQRCTRGDSLQPRRQAHCSRRRQGRPDLSAVFVNQLVKLVEKLKEDLDKMLEHLRLLQPCVLAPRIRQELGTPRRGHPPLEVLKQVWQSGEDATK